MSSPVFPPYIPLDEREVGDSAEIVELRVLIDEHDVLMEDCMNRMLSKQEQRDLDELIALLNLKEQKYWDGVPGETVEMITSHSDVDFPIIRQMLGTQPSEY